MAMCSDKKGQMKSSFDCDYESLKSRIIHLCHDDMYYKIWNLICLCKKRCRLLSLLAFQLTSWDRLPSCMKVKQLQHSSCETHSLVHYSCTDTGMRPFKMQELDNNASDLMETHLSLAATLKPNDSVLVGSSSAAQWYPTTIKASSKHRDKSNHIHRTHISLTQLTLT